EYERPGAFPRGGESAFDEHHVKPLFAFTHSDWTTQAKRKLNASSQLRRETTHSAIAWRWPSATPASASVCVARARHSAASSRERSRPNSAGYVGLAPAASFPAVLPSIA